MRYLHVPYALSDSPFREVVHLIILDGAPHLPRQTPQTLVSADDSMWRHQLGSRRIGTESTRSTSLLARMPGILQSSE